MGKSEDVGAPMFPRGNVEGGEAILSPLVLLLVEHKGCHTFWRRTLLRALP